MHVRTIHRKLAAAAIAAGVIMSLAACSDEGATPESGSGSGSGDSSFDSATLLEESYTGITGEPTDVPAEVEPDMSVWVVSCGEAVTTCANPADGALKGAEAAGWSADLCDGKLNPDGWATCVRQGIAADADVILLGGLDCASVSGPLGEAKDAGIVTIGVGAYDCDKSGGEPLYSAVTTNLADYDADEWWTQVGALQAKYLVAKNDGAAKVLGIDFNDTVWGPFIAEGFATELAKYPESEVLGSIQLSNADVASGALSQKFSTALLQYPEVNAVAVPIDGWFLAGLAQALEASGRSQEITAIGNFGSIPNFGLIAEGTGEDATVAFSGQWDGWAGIDAAIRVMQDLPVEVSGVGLQVVDQENNLPAPGEQYSYSPVIDYQAAYLAAWGRD